MLCQKDKEALASTASERSSKLNSLPNDLLAAVVVFVIAVPLSLGIALASGVPTVAALVSAIIGGVVVGLLSGAPLVVSGPAAGLSAMIFAYVNQYGLAGVYLITMLAGFVQVLFGLLRIGRFIERIPKAILEGVLSAIGFTILVSQLHVLLGQSIPGGVVANIIGIPKSVGAAVDFSSMNIVKPGFFCGLLAVTILIFWPKLFTKLKWLPAALPAILLSTLVAISQNIPRVTLAPLLPHVGAAVTRFFSPEMFNGWTVALIPAVGLAIVASAESLLTARAIGILQKKRNLVIPTNLERELLAQGFGNIVSGALGGMPMTGVMVRSAANIEAGAKSRASTIFHGILVGLFVILFPHVLEQIPLAALASVLVVTGWRLLNFGGLVKEMRKGAGVTYLWPLTMGAILVTDLLKGFGFAIFVWLLTVIFTKVFKNCRRVIKSVADTGS